MKRDAGECGDDETRGDAALGALLGLRTADREPVAAMDDVDVVGLGAGDHPLLGSHLPKLLERVVLHGAVRAVRSARAGHLVVAGAHCDRAPIHRMTTINAPMPRTQMTIASDTGPIRSMPEPPGSLEALMFWM